jgi:hypothetical protein
MSWILCACTGVYEKCDDARGTVVIREKQLKETNQRRQAEEITNYNTIQYIQAIPTSNQINTNRKQTGR